MYRNTYVKINNETLTSNVKKIVKFYNNYKYYIGVVKANAYGHGDYIVNDLIKGGINYLAVSSLEEAISIRKYNKKIPILVLEPINLKYINDILENDVTITIENIAYIEELTKLAINKKLNVHLKIDSGMNRLGFKCKEDLKKAIELLNTNKKIYIEGIYTHLATSGVNDQFYDKQISSFEQITSLVDLSNIPIVHINRSITLVHHKKLPYETGTRLGIIMYGFDSKIKEATGLRKLKKQIIHKLKKISPTITGEPLDVQSAYSLYTEVLSTRQVKKGDFIGYGATYIAKEDMLIATLPIGYADGMSPKIKYVIINNKKCEILGDICMDMTIVRIDSSIKIHDRVEVFGDKTSIRSIANMMGTNVYHVLTGITSRVPRVYQDNEEIKY